MITQLHIQNFKSHQNTQINLKPLTILTGINGSGKSSIIQSLLLLRQSFKKQRLNNALELNKPLCEIGTGKDAIYQFSNEDFLGLSFIENGNSYKWKFSAKNTKDFSGMYLPILQYEGLQNFVELSLFNNNFHYLSAGRLPELKYKRDDYAVEQECQISIENGYGELVAQYLFNYGNTKVQDHLINKKVEFNELIYQVTAWEREISPNVNVSAKKEGEQFTIKYSFDGYRNYEPTDEFKTQNVGFGLTYALPIITVLLSAKPGSLILIENPEAHLHPQGQSSLAGLIALAANAGIQIITETHSDHIINGILTACKKHDQQQEGISKDNVKLIYFKEKAEQHASQYEEINILDGGKIENQPDGFFDQIQKDFEAIMGF